MNSPRPAYPLLDRIQTPADLRKLSEDQLGQVCYELRDFIIDVVSVKGGHFGASLGVVACKPEGSPNLNLESRASAGNRA